jgi:hypothetical protein
MDVNWIWIFVASVGQATCVASVVLYARANPDGRYRLWRGPAGQTIVTRLAFALGLGVTIFGASLLNSSLQGLAIRVLVGVVCVAPAVAAMIVANIVLAARRRRATSPLLE